MIDTMLLNDLTCPAEVDAKPCRGGLTLDESSVPAIRSSVNGDEIIEGMLRCQTCSQAYPILAGVPILLAQPWLYIRDNYDVFLALTAEAGQPISREMLNGLRTASSEIGFTGKGGGKYDQRDILGTYLCQHYDSPWELLPKNHPLLALLREYYTQDFYSAMIELSAPFLTKRQRVLDVGCGVGRSVYEFSKQVEHVIGVEYSFGSALIARRMLRHTPARMDGYSVKLDGDIYVRRSLPDVKRDNVEIIVASGDNLPFRDSVFDVVNHWNVIDRVPNPEKFLAEQERILKDAGISIMADPYTWDISYSPRDHWLGGANVQRSIEAVRGRVRKTCEILQEQEYIPWLSWKYERNFSLFYCHGLIAQKRAAGKEQNHVD